jgi:phosphonate transport system permease protein
VIEAGAGVQELEEMERGWQARRRARVAATLLHGGVLLACLLASAWMTDVSPAALSEGMPRVGAYFVKLAPTLHWHALLDGTGVEGSLAYWFYRLDSWAWLLFETTQIAALATLGGAAVAVVLCFPAAANLAPNRATYIVCRRVLELFRTVPDIVYALILVYAFGVGPPAGIFAIGLHTVGALGKQFAEAVENADMRAWEAVRASGGNWVQAVRYAIVPQVAPNLLSYALLRFEINVRASTVIGFVGAGGIGQELYQVISQNYDEEVSAIVVLIILLVAAIDLSSEWLRSWAVGQGA